MIFSQCSLATNIFILGFLLHIWGWRNYTNLKIQISLIYKQHKYTYAKQSFSFISYEYFLTYV